MKSEKVKEGYTVYTFETGEKYRIVQTKKNLCKIQKMRSLMSRLTPVGLMPKWEDDLYFKLVYRRDSIEEALKALEEEEKGKIEALNYPIYH